jgi:hypothetical protein
MLRVYIIVRRNAELPAEVKYATAMTNDKLLTLSAEKPVPDPASRLHILTVVSSEADSIIAGSVGEVARSLISLMKLGCGED